MVVPLVQIDIGLLADQVGVSAADTLDLGQGVHNLLLSVDIGVEKTENLPIVSILSNPSRRDRFRCKMSVRPWRQRRRAQRRCRFRRCSAGEVEG